ncbi:aldo/keto reductase [Rhodococcus sp. 05-2256-B2]|uniref:aldo/keto reductase n=1 Tax=unclassified Rhodococcus (in: high G+C Gram-positive bacteria) TaxID=192944 RepID=UPI000B9ABC3C|nr:MULTISPECIES: aldo/keto reductase [unclassified Rhodococcus (in: high G+C Gram-positive bacteria)]OZD88722.1 aldo/keto reductase [Rhodococcus sp. 05-2256-B4]OZD91802.1 aldo/keto reductase [Rhodococcus sp. 05-2256-B2]OZD95134.1 aldo/keto reductase [Rhodococcus sp. 05-2256-B3]OZE02288.1 aldo/keto reductase [Rhodococcus sp. 05-2256-B1]
MRTRTLGSSGIEVGEIGLGCMGMSFAYSANQRDASESSRVINTAIDLGATLIDTADVYGPFTNEELVGTAIKGRRDEVTLATKVGMVIDDRGGLAPNGHPGHIRSGIEASLQRLGTDVIDLYQLHRVDPQVALDETWGAMAELVERGLVRAVGLSEVTVDQLDTAHAIHPVASVQTELSLWSTEQLAEVVPWCAAHNAAFIPYSPLGRGFLTGAVSTSDDLEADDWRHSNPRFSAEAIAANQSLLDTVRQVATDHDATPVQIALAWVLAQGTHVIPIPGTKREKYLRENVKASDLVLSADDLDTLSTISTRVVGTRY